MPRPRYTAEQIIGRLREAEVLLSHPAWKAGQVGRRWAKLAGAWGLATTPTTALPRSQDLRMAERVWRPPDGPSATPEDPGAGELPVEEARGGPVVGQGRLEGGGLGKPWTATRAG